MASYALRLSTFTLCLAALCPATSFSQVDSDVSSPATPAAAQAFVYVGTTSGVYLYDAAPNGSLSLVSGSPFSVAGSAVGSNGEYFVSLGTLYLRSYPVASSGAIKNQASQINTQLRLTLVWEGPFLYNDRRRLMISDARALASDDSFRPFANFRQFGRVALKPSQRCFGISASDRDGLCEFVRDGGNHFSHHADPVGVCKLRLSTAPGG